MALVKVLDKYDLREEFRAMDRDYFTLEGYQAILDLFDECDCGRITELDVIAICCEFTEESPDYVVDSYCNIEEILDCRKNGNIEIDKLLDVLNYYTYAIQLDNGNILYQDF